MSEPIIRLTNKPIDLNCLLANAADPRTGAVVVFLGITRQLTGDKRTERLRYETYRQMALDKIRQLWDQAAERWSVRGGGVIHRTGEVLPGEASVAIVVATSHRQQAFEAARWLIDQLKQVVPIWKREIWSDGTGQWIHPGLDEPTGSHEENAS